MKKLLVSMFFVLIPALACAELVRNTGESTGVGYLVKADGVRIYGHFEGDEVVATVNRDFPMVAYESRSAWLGIVAAESVAKGRAHVRYWNNGQDSRQGERMAWVDIKDVDRFTFDCCGDSGHCSGITKPLFSVGGYTDCFIQAASAVTREKASPVASGSAELEKLKYQLELERLKLEIEKVKLEQERVRAGAKQ